MAVVNSVKDSLKLLFSDSYKISDSDYNSLSGILISKGVSELAFESGLVQIIKVMHETGAKFPMSMNFLQGLWQEYFINVNFVKYFVPLVSEGFFRINKVQKSTLSSRNILYSSQEDLSLEKCVVVYSTQKFNELYIGFSEILSKYKFELTSYINEGVELAPKKVRQIFDKTNKMLASMGVKASIESYMKDNSTGVEELNIIFSGISEYKISENDLKRKAVKFLKMKNSQVEVYLESKSDMFLGVSITKDDYSNIARNIVNFINDLEVNEVKNERGAKVEY